jgi:hypothetical protein
LRNFRMAPQDFRPTSVDELKDIVAGALAQQTPL